MTWASVFSIKLVPELPGLLARAAPTAQRFCFQQLPIKIFNYVLFVQIIVAVWRTQWQVALNIV